MRRIAPACSRPATKWPARCAALVAALALSACQSGVLDPQGIVGSNEKTILIDSLAIMLTIVVPTICATLGVAWWYRAGNARAGRMPGFVYSGQLELIVWAIPLLTIMLLGGVAWIGSHDLDPAKPLESRSTPLPIEVVSLDWKWLFIYPDQGIASVNDLTIPTGVPVHFSLTSASVMNAFFIAQMGSMIYTMNGMSTQLNLVADKPGIYHGISSHFSGDGFADMHFDVHAVPPADFAAWVATAHASGPTLTAQSYADLAKQSVPSHPFTYRGVDRDLYNKIVMQTLPPGPGPLPRTNPGAPASAED